MKVTPAIRATLIRDHSYKQRRTAIIQTETALKQRMNTGIQLDAPKKEKSIPLTHPVEQPHPQYSPWRMADTEVKTEINNRRAAPGKPDVLQKLDSPTFILPIRLTIGGYGPGQHQEGRSFDLELPMELKWECASETRT